MSEPVPSDGTVVVIGASLAGLRAAEEVRHEGHTGPVVVVGEETHAPYDRPPLSKQLLSGKWDVERIHHHTPDALDATGLDFRLGRRATGLDVATRTVALDDGTELAYDGLIVATGAATRSLPGTEGMPGVWMLRTLDDCLGIRADLAAAGTGAPGGGDRRRVHRLRGGRHLPGPRRPGDAARGVPHAPGPGAGRRDGADVRRPARGQRHGPAVRRHRRPPGVGPRRSRPGRRVPRRRHPAGGRRGRGGDRGRALGGMAGGLGPAPRQRGGVRRGALRRRPGGRRRRRGQLDPTRRRAGGPGSSTGRMPPKGERRPPATCWPARPAPSPTTPSRSSGPTSTPPRSR